MSRRDLIAVEPTTVMLAPFSVNGIPGAALDWSTWRAGTGEAAFPHDEDTAGRDAVVREQGRNQAGIVQDLRDDGNAGRGGHSVGGEEERNQIRHCLRSRRLSPNARGGDHDERISGHKLGAGNGSGRRGGRVGLPKRFCKAVEIRNTPSAEAIGLGARLRGHAAPSPKDVAAGRGRATGVEV